MVYISIKVAFDSADRSALWLTLKGVGAPDVLLNLVPDLCTSVRVSVGARLLLCFYTTSGVQQGMHSHPGAMLPSYQLDLRLAAPHVGIKVGQEAFADQDCADSTAACRVEKQKSSSPAHQAFQDTARTMGLSILEQKSKV